jgi:hypothetical protein
MEPITLILVPGILGGVIFAAIIFRLQRPEGTTDVVRFSPTDVINAAHIRVAGVGGLGLVAMAAAVALAVPRIRLTLAIGCLLGVGLAAALIYYRRRRSGPLPSSGQGAGANTVLRLEEGTIVARPDEGRFSQQEEGSIGGEVSLRNPPFLPSSL